MNTHMIPGNGPVTMSSREIADLCEKRHDNVMRDIEKMLQDIGDLKTEASSFEAEYTTPQNKRAKEYRLPKDLTVTLITGYRADLRYKVVKRLEELEVVQANRTNALPDLSDPAVLLPLLSTYANRTQIAEAKVAEMEPKAEAFSLLDGAEGSVSVRVAAKMLGVPERKFIHWLEANQWAYRQNGIGQLQAYAEKRNSGFLDHRPHTYHDRTRGEDRMVAQMLITPKGLARLAQIFAKKGAPL